LEELSKKTEHAVGVATLVVARTLDGDAGQRQVYVDLDGERIATLLVGESVTRDIPAGEHQLKLDNTLVKKRYTFTATPGGRIEYRFANTTGRFALPFLAVMGVAPLYLRVETNAQGK
jgi:hypothetical protein